MDLGRRDRDEVETTVVAGICSAGGRAVLSRAKQAKHDMVGLNKQTTLNDFDGAGSGSLRQRVMTGLYVVERESQSTKLQAN